MENKKTTPLTQKISFEDLTPNTDVDISNYKAALDHAFLDSDLRNIAITGPYGAGKSSILQTYLKQDGSLKNKFIRISLSHLQPTRNGTPIADSKLKKDAPEVNADEPHEDTHDVTQIEQMLEGKILNQMIHKLPANVVNTAGFHSIRLDQEMPSKTFHFGSTILVTLFLVCFFVPFLYVHFAPASIKSDFSMISYETFIILYLIFIALSAVLVAITYKHPKFLRNTIRHIHHVKVQGNEIELFQDSDSPYFDKYLDSILFMLSNSGKQYFIFEDIDRFDTTLIFERLKEINELVNEQESQQESPKDKSVIKFIYLLRDDIFINKERTKFFDFIIPVIPVTNTSNSSDQLKKILNTYHLDETVNPDLVRGLGFYIEDLRLIKNIANEYRIYYRALVKSNNLDPNKLLAMITYKNLFPKDFSELQKQHGYVHFLLSNDGKNIFTDRAAEAIRLEKEQLQADHAMQTQEIAQSKEELIWAMISHYKDNSSRTYSRVSVPVIGSNYTIEQLEKFLVNSGWYLPQNIEDYNKRKALIQSKENDSKQDYFKQLKEYDDRINAIKISSFTDLATRYPRILNQMFKENERDNNDRIIFYDCLRDNEYFGLLKYLLINGYIDESYGEYTSYFYGEFLTNDDQRFIMNVHNNGMPLWDIPLTNVKIIIKNISSNEFERPCVLNYDLIHHLLIDANNGDPSASNISDTLSRLFSNFQGDYFPYANQYINKADNYLYFGLILLKALPESYANLRIDDPEHMEQLVYAVITHFGKEDLDNINSVNNQALTTYINSNPDFLKVAGSVKDPMINKLISQFELLKVSFHAINPTGVSENLLHAVFENSLYDLNGQNLLVLFVNIAKYDKNTAITEPLTCLKKLSDDSQFSKLCKPWTEDMPAFIDSAVSNIKTYEKSDLKFSDQPEILQELMNNDSIEKSRRRDYISNVLPQHIPTLANIDTKMWKTLVDNDVLSHSEENIHTYVNLFGMDDHLIGSINKYYGDCLDVRKTDNDDIHQFVVNKISSQNGIHNQVYTSLLKAIQAKIKDIAPICELQNEDKIAILVSNHFLAMNKGIFDFIAENYPDQTIPYIKSDYAGFRKSMENGNIIIPAEFVNTLIEDQTISDQDKIAFIDASDGKLELLSHMNLSDEVKCHIIETNLDSAEIPSILEKYDKFSEKVQNEIIQLYPEYEEAFTTPEALKNWNLMLDICQSKNIEDPYKAILAAKLASSINKEQLLQLMSGMENSGYSQILKKGDYRNVAIPHAEENNTLLQELKNFGYLKDYSPIDIGYHIERNNKKDSAPSK